MKKTLAILTAALGLTISAYARGYSGHDYRGNFWHYDIDRNGDVSGHDYHGNFWGGHFNPDGSFDGHDFHGHFWHTEPD